MVWLTACGGCGPAEKGESCDPADTEACVEGFTCLEKTAGEFACLLPVGSSCNPTEEDYCELGATCTKTQEGNAGRCLLGRAAACDPNGANVCGEGLTCASTQDGKSACYEQVILAGNVLNATDRAAIEGAQVIGLDELATSVTDVAVTNANGNYELSVPAVRDGNGKPIAQFYTLRVAAQDYQLFPSGLRTALPIDLSAAAKTDSGVYRIESALTEVLLLPLPEDQRGQSSIKGRVVSSTSQSGVLVVAETAGQGYSALTDRSGNFTIFNVPDASFEVRGYIKGVQFTPQMVKVAGADVEDVELTESKDGLATLSGNVDIVNAPGDSLTSVVLVVASTFNDTFVRGEVPIGLRAPKEGAPNISKSWQIADVPAGEYVVLAAFENDALVRDPDTNISGTEIVRITVAPGAGPVDLSDSFKVTEALAIQSPGQNEPEAVMSKPTLRWADDSSEDFYELKVYNAYGELVWEKTVPKSQEDLAIPYEGPLQDGMYYQFRVTSWRQPGNKDPSPISSTEDLRGVFFKPISR